MIVKLKKCKLCNRRYEYYSDSISQTRGVCIACEIQKMIKRSEEIENEISDNESL
jgi:hypothetical protein